MEYEPYKIEDMLNGKLHFYCVCTCYIVFLKDSYGGIDFYVTFSLVSLDICSSNTLAGTVLGFLGIMFLAI
jgi:hypothetical protein